MIIAFLLSGWRFLLNLFNNIITVISCLIYSVAFCGWWCYNWGSRSLNETSNGCTCLLTYCWHNESCSKHWYAGWIRIKQSVGGIIFFRTMNPHFGEMNYHSACSICIYLMKFASLLKKYICSNNYIITSNTIKNWFTLKGLNCLISLEDPLLSICPENSLASLRNTCNKSWLAQMYTLDASEMLSLFLARFSSFRWRCILNNRNRNQWCGERGWEGERLSVWIVEGTWAGGYFIIPL